VTVKVRATAKGFYGYFREPGDVFEIAERDQFSARWMEAVEKSEPKPAKPAKEAKQ
jgi:hypothetical protein